MITEYQREALRFEGQRPVAVGDQSLAQPTRIAQTGAGFWGLFVVGDHLVVVHPGGALAGPAGRAARPTLMARPEELVLEPALPA